MNSNKRPTIKDIAKIAGVSHVTVSQALRDLPCISQSTKKRIQQIAKEIGYTPNLAARNLALQSPTSIGMIVPTLGAETAYNEIINSVTELAERDDLCLLLGSCNRNIELEKSYCRTMCENRIGALLIASCTNESSHIKEICNDLVPIIFIGGKTDETEENYIIPDTYESGQIAVNYLYELGHRKIALFLYQPENNTILSKKNGYIAAMKKHNLEPIVYWSGTNRDTFQGGFLLTEELIKNKRLPSAIWCASDLMAYGVMESLKKNHIGIGTQVSVIGHDNLYFSHIPSNSLTTMALAKEQIAETAIQYAKELMAYRMDSNLQKPICKCKIPNKLVIRDSTGPYIG